jgi:hypothetical protein
MPRVGLFLAAGAASAAEAPGTMCMIAKDAAAPSWSRTKAAEPLALDRAPEVRAAEAIDQVETALHAPPRLP